MNTIHLISDDETIQKYLDQHRRLTEALRHTERVLRALGVEEIDDKGSSTEEEEINDDLIEFIQGRGPTLKDLVREAAAAMPDDFTRDNIKDYISKEYPDRKFQDSSFGVTLSTVAKEDGWNVVTPGSGGKPSVYEMLF